MKDLKLSLHESVKCNHLVSIQIPIKKSIETYIMSIENKDLYWWKVYESVRLPVGYVIGCPFRLTNRISIRHCILGKIEEYINCVNKTKNE